MSLKIKCATKLAEIHNINLNSKDLKIVQIPVNYTKTMNELFKNDDKLLILKYNNEGNLWCSHFKGTYTDNVSNHYGVLFKSLKMFGLMNEKQTYNQWLKSFLEKGLLVKEVETFASFNDFLINSEIKFDFQNRSFRNILFTSIFLYIKNEGTKFHSIKNNISKFNKTGTQYDHYKGLFNAIYLATFKKECPKYIEQNSEKIISKNNKSLQELSKSIRQTKIEKKIKKMIDYDPNVSRLRKIHRNDIKGELYQSLQNKALINDEITTFDLAVKIGAVAEAAHIISVKDCLLSNEYHQISDKNNGLLLDPTTHRMFDKGLLMFSDDLKTLIPTEESHIDKSYKFEISKEFLTKERIFYIKKWNKK